MYKTKLPFFLLEGPLAGQLFSYHQENFSFPPPLSFQNTAIFKFCVHGKAKLKIDDSIYEVSRNSLVFVPPFSELQWYELVESMKLENFSFNFFFFYYLLRLHTSISWSEAQMIDFLKKNACIKLSEYQYFQIFSYFKAIQMEIKNEEELSNQERMPFSGISIMTILLQLAIFFYRSHEYRNREKIIGARGKQAGKKIFSHFYNKIHWSELCYSNKDVYNESLSIIRLQKAYLLLVYTDYTIENISQKLGFSNSSNFIHFFKRLTEQSPNEFRKNLENQHYKDIRFWSTAALTTEILTFFSKHCFNNDFLPGQAYSDLHLSSGRVREKIKSYSGLSPSLFTDYLRIMEACKLLINNEEKTISEIAHELGYQSVKTFYRKFKKWKKISPGEYRKRHLQKYHQISFWDLGIDC